MYLHRPPVWFHRPHGGALTIRPAAQIDETPPLGYIDTRWAAVVPPTASASHPTDHLPPGLAPVRTHSPSSSLSSSRLSLCETLVEDAEGGEEESKLDRFAPVYVPQWLRTLPPPHYTGKIPAAPPFPLPDYNPPLLTARVQTRNTPIPDVCPSILSPSFPSVPLVPFDEVAASTDGAYYASHFSSLLALHLEEQVAEMDRAILHNIPVDMTTDKGDSYRITIPGIREDSPKLNIGDRMMFRGLYESLKQGSLAEVEGEVVGMIKSKGWVFVRARQLGELDRSLPRIDLSPRDIAAQFAAGPNGAKKRLPAAYQIRFLVNGSSVCVMQDAVRSLGWAMNNKEKTARRWLFPEPGDVAKESRTPAAIEWVDPALNGEQQGAVADIVNRRHNVPYLISGPPGTGKTKTMVEAVQQVLAHNPYASILLCAPSNPAADTLARRLAKTLGPNDMFRLNAPNRTFAEVGDDLMPYCCIDGDAFGLPPVDQLMSYRVVVSTCLDADILNVAKVNNWSVMGQEWEMHKKLHPRSHGYVPMFPHWTHLLVDEAAQASEPETLVPLSVVQPYPIDPACPMIDITVVLCGDIHQLGPVISSRKARDFGLDVSLLERLFERPVYHDHPRARRTMRQAGVESPYPAPFANLIRNYRSIAPILMLPAALFYDDSLEACARDVKLVGWTKLPYHRIPVLFAGTETAEDWVAEGASWYNAGEIDKTIELVESMLKEISGLEQKEIAVITPWREQVWRMRIALRKAGYGGVDVGNVETYQGGEFRVTIVSCVRSQERFLEGDRVANMGLFNEPKRFNVAITRAKELLVVVGNANLLKRDPYWNGLLQICLRNSLYKGPRVDMNRTEAYLSRIERQIGGNLLSTVEQTMFLADAVARQALRDN